MKRFSHKSERGPALSSIEGFTLVELLVVVSIIAILAAVGLVVYTNIQKGMRDAKRKADINAIASAYESKFDSVKGVYSVLTDANFQSGKMPTPPENPTGAYRFIAGPNNISSPVMSLYRVCANLEGSGDIYCRSSSQGSAAATTAGSCSNFRMPVAGGGTRDGIPGDSQVCRSWLSEPFERSYDPNRDMDRDGESEVWVSCNATAEALDCALSCRNTGNIDWYDSLADARASKKQNNQVWIYSRSCDDWRHLTTVHLYM